MLYPAFKISSFGKDQRYGKQRKTGESFGIYHAVGGVRHRLRKCVEIPWMCGQNGGGSFMLIYVICLIVLGLPTMIMEFSVGRAAQTSPLYMYRKLSGGRGKWNLWGIVCLIGNIALIAFYAVVSGWILYYFVKISDRAESGFRF